MTQENMLLIPEGSEVTEISIEDYNRDQINSISTLYPEYRQQSKAP